jgi:hypothetical protein
MKARTLWNQTTGEKLRTLKQMQTAMAVRKRNWLIARSIYLIAKAGINNIACS